MNSLLSFQLSIQAMPCTNQCGHCWIEGSPRHTLMPFETLNFVLESLADVAKSGIATGFVLFDEPTIHPEFVRILHRLTELDLIWPDFFLPTNGAGLARAPESTWAAVKALPSCYLQLSVHGMEQTHDAFARRQGAFKDVLGTLTRALEKGIECTLTYFLTPENLAEYAQIKELLHKLDPSDSTRVGAIPCLWQGRGSRLPRPRPAQLAAHNIRYSPRFFATEADVIQHILADPEMAARRPGTSVCAGQGSAQLLLDPDLQLYTGQFCDGGGILSVVPEYRQHFRVGELDRRGFSSVIAALQTEQVPSGIAALNQTTWGELAEKYGDKENDEIFYIGDLPQGKWAAAYLREVLPVSLS